MSRILALDYGTKRIGIALSDETKTIAQALPVVSATNQKAAVSELQALVQEQAVEAILLGLPVGLAGQDTEQTRGVRKFAQLLATSFPGLPLTLVDERFTTREAKALLKAAGKNWKQSREAVDSLSAWVLLQTHLRNLKF